LYKFGFFIKKDVHSKRVWIFILVLDKPLSTN
jgi:hypothetical protein